MTGLRGSVISMGMANGLDAALHFVIPIALVRLLSVEQFGEYRLLWLAASSAMLFAPMGMPRSLQYFLPRNNEADRCAFIDQTCVFMLITACLAAFFFLPSSPLLPSTMKGFVDSSGYLVSLFVLFWVAASLLDVLPSAMEKYRHQVFFIIIFSLVRTVGVLMAAWYYHDVEYVVTFLVGFAIIKYAVLLMFRYSYTRKVALRTSRNLWYQQIKYALPFGINGMLNKGRIVTEQWIVAIMFTSAQYAVFTIAASFYPLLNVIKSSVNYVTVPKMSRLQSQGRTERLLELNNKGNIAVTFLLYPVLAFLLVNAEMVVGLLYTDNYSVAANIMRLYSCGMSIMAIEISSILIVYQQGPHMMRTGILMITTMVIVAVLGAKTFGLVGVAFGGVTAVLIGTIRNYARVIHITATPLRKIQQWDTIGIIALAASMGSIGSQWIALSLMATHANYIQLSSILVLNILLYSCLLALFRRGWLFAQFWNSQ
jgi:O-antigen/teichoic acid export membrane protein